jgi:hypothetical protein
MKTSSDVVGSTVDASSHMEFATWRPATLHRVLFSLTIGLAACGFLVLTRHYAPDARTDFSAVWNGARLLASGENPYELIGPDRPIVYDFRLHYPATSLVPFITLVWLKEFSADLVFVFSSAALLAFGATKENWNRIWIFPSAAFIVAARAGQFSPLIAAGYFLPLAAALLPIKPTTGFAVLTSWRSRRVWIAAGAVGLAILAISLVLQPGWLNDWLAVVLASRDQVSPVRALGGFVLLLSALRWKQREARLLLFLALVPQVQSWYEALLPMLVARTKTECQILSMVSSLGYLLMIPLVMMSPTRELARSTVGDMMVAFAYLPALIVLLRRPKDYR